MPAPRPPHPPRRARQRGMTLISVLVSLLVFAFGLHYLIDQPIQNRIRAWLKARGRSAAVSQPVVSLEG